MTETLRIGVVGVGHMGWNHAKLYNEISTADLVGVSDKDQRRSVEVAEELGTDSLTKDELLSVADAVTIAVPTQYHGELVRDCYDAGVHVLVEKPFVDDIRVGTTLVEQFDDSELTLQVGHVERFNPAVQTLIDIASHQDIVALSTRRVGPDVDRELTDSVALDLMIHDIDIILSILDDSIVELTGVSMAGGEHATAGMRFENGVVVDMTASRISQRDERTIEVVTKSNCIIADCINQTVEVHRKQPAIVDSLNGHRLYQCEGVVERPRVTQANPLKSELTSFIENVTSGAEPEVSGWDGLRAVDIAQRIEGAATNELLGETLSQ